jgi:hypothetical protein
MFLRVGPISYLQNKNRRVILTFKPSCFWPIFNTQSTELLKKYPYYILDSFKNLSSFVVNCQPQVFAQFVNLKEVSNKITDIYNICVINDKIDYMQLIDRIYKINHSIFLDYCLEKRKENLAFYLIKKIGYIDVRIFNKLVISKMENIISLNLGVIKNYIIGEPVTYFIDNGFSYPFIKIILEQYISNKRKFTPDQIKINEISMFMTALKKGNIDIINLLANMLSPDSLEGSISLPTNIVTFYTLISRKVPINKEDLESLVKYNSNDRVKIIFDTYPSFRQTVMDLAYLYDNKDLLIYSVDNNYYPSDDALFRKKLTSKTKKLIEERKTMTDEK